jgi:hypothetical protein
LSQEIKNRLQASSFPLFRLPFVLCLTFNDFYLFLNQRFVPCLTGIHIQVIFFGSSSGKYFLGPHISPDKNYTPPTLCLSSYYMLDMIDFGTMIGQ